jgi:hypothetical protein
LGFHELPGFSPGGPAVSSRWGEVGGTHVSGKPLFVHIDGRHQVQSQKRQVGEVIACERFTGEMSVDTTKPPEAPFCSTDSFEVRQNDLLGVADENPLHRSFATDEHPDLPVDFPGDFGQGSGKLLSDQRSRRDASLVKLLEALLLERLESYRVT